MKLGAVIATAGRASVQHAVLSAVRSGFDEVVVVNDGSVMLGDLSWMSLPQVKYCKLGRNYGRLNGVLYYGQIPLTVGMYMSDADFTASMGDDDEYTEGAATAIRQKIQEQPGVDIWVPGLQFTNGMVLCVKPGLYAGNVSHVIYRPEIFATVPMCHVRGEDYSLHDFFHAKRCVDMGFKIDWIGQVCVNARPALPGTNGRGD